MKAHILGGGPCGLAIVDGLRKNSDSRFVLIEQDCHLGGLAKTLSWGQNSHDLGPHKLFTLDKALMNRVQSLLPKEDWLCRPKTSRIYIGGKYLPYPPSPFSLLGIYGPWHFSKMIFDYGLAKVRTCLGSKTPKSFCEDLSQRVGTSLYEALFAPIARKLWDDPTRLDVKLSQGRVQTPSLGEILGRLIKIQKNSNFEALEFQYPKGGIGRLWSTIKNATKTQGEFLTGKKITQLELRNGRLVSIYYEDRENQTSQWHSVDKNDMVFSTLPLGKTIELLQNGSTPKFFPNELISEARKSIQLNDLNLVFLKIEEKQLFKDSWIFIPDPNILFHRVSEQRAFDPEMSGSGSIVCCEVMDNKLRPNSKKSDETLTQECISDLRKMGFQPNVTETKVIRLPRSYPVFGVGYEQSLKQILSYLDQIPNLRTIGRQGAFNYIGTLDAMDIGYGAADWFLNSFESAQKSKGGTWLQERERTAHYPVLD